MRETKIEGQKQINTAIIGYGFSGSVFHAPFIQKHPRFNLHSIVTSGNRAGTVYPNTQIVRDINRVTDNPEIDLVVICTPHFLHTGQAELAIDAGKHVIIEKPVALNSAGFIRIMEKAAKKGKLIFPFHNRRWDGDFLTVKKILAEGHLGEIVSFESRFDRYTPVLNRAEWRYLNEDGGGTLFDLGTHLIDQSLCLFGKPTSVFCLLYNQRERSKANDSFDLKLIYPRHTASLRASVFTREPGPRFEVHGTYGSYVKYFFDRQEESLKRGIIPDNKNFGLEPRKCFGILHTEKGTDKQKIKYPTQRGNYMGFWDDVAATLLGKKPQEVTPESALLNLNIIEAAFLSHKEKCIVDL